MAFYCYVYDKGKFRGGRISTQDNINAYIYSEIKKIKSFEDFEDLIELTMDGIFFDQRSKGNTFVYDLIDNISESAIKDFMDRTNIGSNIKFIEAYAKQNNLDIEDTKDFSKIMEDLSDFTDAKFLQFAIDMDFITFDDVWEYFKSFWDNFIERFDASDKVIYLYFGSNTTTDRLRISNVVGLKEIKSGDIISNSDEVLENLIEQCDILFNKSLTIMNESDSNESSGDYYLELYNRLNLKLLKILSFKSDQYIKKLTIFGDSYFILSCLNNIYLVTVNSNVIDISDVKKFYNFIFDKYLYSLNILKFNFINSSIIESKLFSTDKALKMLKKDKLSTNLSHFSIPKRLIGKILEKDFYM